MCALSNDESKKYNDRHCAFANRTSYSISCYTLLVMLWVSVKRYERISFVGQSLNI
jgi:hypothetical protein